LINDQIEQLQRGGVDPVHVLTDHHRGLPRSQPSDLRDQCFERPLLTLLRAKVEGGIATLGRNRQQLRQQRSSLVEIVRRPSE
jgi:hypothetical protein